jgi:excisionase family DNA binding protein
MEKLLDAKEAAGLLNISEVALRKWVRQGRVPTTRLGRRTLFDPRALDRFIRSQTTAARQVNGRGGQLAERPA